MIIGAIDIGGTKTMVGAVDENGNVLVNTTFKTITADVNAHFALCEDRLRSCLSELGVAPESIAGVGIALPGMVDKAHERLDNAVFSGWRDVPARAAFQEMLGNKNVFIDNDVNACAIGEIAFGAGRHYSDFVWSTVSTGVGGASVSGGRLLEGHLNFAGELGHVKVEYEHPALCPCGQYGCLEAHGSGHAITRETLRVIRENPAFAAMFAEKNLPIDSAGCAQLAEAGVPEALALFRQAGTYLGRGFAYAINLLNPQAIILGGGVVNSFDLIESAIMDTIRVCAATRLSDVDVIKTHLGYQAAFLGAAALVLNAREKGVN